MEQRQAPWLPASAAPFQSPSFRVLGCSVRPGGGCCLAQGWQPSSHPFTQLPKQGGCVGKSLFLSFPSSRRDCVPMNALPCSRPLSVSLAVSQPVAAPSYEEDWESACLPRERAREAPAVKGCYNCPPQKRETREKNGWLRSHNTCSGGARIESHFFLPAEPVVSTPVWHCHPSRAPPHPATQP